MWFGPHVKMLYLRQDAQQRILTHSALDHIKMRSDTIILD